MKTKDGETIEWKYNFSVYWSFLKKYKFLFVFILFLVLSVEALFVVDKFLLKLIIDNGTEFTESLQEC